MKKLQMDLLLSLIHIYYQNYLDESDGMITEPWEHCLEVAREIYNEGGFQ